MAGRSMFEHCLAADLRDSLRGATEELAQLVIVIDSNDRGKTDIASSDKYWVSGDSLTGRLSIQRSGLITVARAQVKFEGVCRMHTIVLDSNGQPRPIPNFFAYKFLLQVQDLAACDFTASTPDKNGDIVLSASFDFQISDVVLSKGNGIPLPCLNLPPSMTVGNEIRDDHSTHTYAQPKVSYSLVAEVEYESAGGRQFRLSSMKEIPLWTFSTPGPPINTRDFPAEFVEITCHPCRLHLFSKKTFLLRVSCQEPPVVVLPTRKISGSTSCSIFITLEGNHVSLLSVAARRISVKVFPILRIKTFYSIQPFSQMPSQNMLAMKRGTRLHEELRVSSNTSYEDLTWHNTSDGTN